MGCHRFALVASSKLKKQRCWSREEDFHNELEGFADCFVVRFHTGSTDRSCHVCLVHVFPCERDLLFCGFRRASSWLSSSCGVSMFLKPSLSKRGTILAARHWIDWQSARLPASFLGPFSGQLSQCQARSPGQVLATKFHILGTTFGICWAALCFHP